MKKFNKEIKQIANQGNIKKMFEKISNKKKVDVYIPFEERYASTINNYLMR